MKIRFYVKHVFGVTNCYVLDYAQELQQLTGKKTIDSRDIKSLTELGCTFEQVLDPATLTEKL